MSNTEPGRAVPRTTGKAVLRGGAWSAARIVGPQLFVVIVSVAAARFLGSDQMGRQSFISFIALSTAAVFNGGLSQMLTRFVGEGLGGERRSETRGLVSRSYRFSFLAAFLGGAALISAALAGQEPTAAWMLAGVGCALAIAQAIPNAILSGSLQWRQTSIIGLVTGGIAVPITIVVLAGGGGITGFFAVEVGMIGTNMIWSELACRRTIQDLGPEIAHDRTLERRALRFAALTTVLILLSTVVFKRSEFFFLQHYSGNSAIAVYSIAFASVYAITALTEALGNTVMPAFATLFGSGDNERIRLGFERGQRLLILFSLPVTALAVSLGPQVLSLVYGREYSETGQLLQIMALGVPLLALMGLANAFLNGLGRIRPVLVITAIAAGANLALAFSLIPPLHARGAALANLGSQVVVAAITIAYANRMLGRRGIHPRTVLATLTACCIAGGLGSIAAEGITGVPGVLVGALAAASSFAVVAAIAKPIRPDDADWLRGSTSETLLAQPAAVACRFFTCGTATAS